MSAAPISFDRQDEGHTAHGPLTWKVIQNHYSIIGTYPRKKYNNITVLTGPFGGSQSNNKEFVTLHFNDTNNYEAIKKIKYQKFWQK